MKFSYIIAGSSLPFVCLFPSTVISLTFSFDKVINVSSSARLWSDSRFCRLRKSNRVTWLNSIDWRGTRRFFNSTYDLAGINVIFCRSEIASRSERSSIDLAPRAANILEIDLLENHGWDIRREGVSDKSESLHFHFFARYTNQRLSLLSRNLCLHRDKEWRLFPCFFLPVF